MTYPDDLTTVTVRHTVTDTSGRPSVGPVLVTLTDRLWTDTGTIVPTKYVGEDLGDGVHEFVVPALDQDGITPQGAALRITEQVPGTPRPFYILPLVEHAAAEHVWARDIMSPPPKPGGGISYVTGPVTDSTMAEVAGDPDSAFTTSLKSTIGTEVGDQLPGQIAGLPDIATAVADKIEQRDLISSTAITRILTTTDPETPTQDGDLLLVYAAPPREFTDFTTGLSGFTPRWADTGAWATATDPTGDDGQVIQVPSAFTRKLLSRDFANGAADVDMTTRVKVSVVGSYYSGGLAARASGGDGSETGYVLVTHTGRLLIVRYTNGVLSNPIGIANFAYQADQWYRLRFRVQGTVLRAKIWADTDPEPTAWTLERSDDIITGGEWSGLFTGALTTTWDSLGTALDGAAAPKAAI